VQIVEFLVVSGVSFQTLRRVKLDVGSATHVHKKYRRKTLSLHRPVVSCCCTLTAQPRRNKCSGALQRRTWIDPRLAAHDPCIPVATDRYNCHHVITRIARYISESIV